jgi:hypothetical protein
MEMLEIRDLLAAVSVDVGQVVRPVDTQLLGVNTAWWDSSLNTAETAQMVEAAGLNFFRLPGGSSADTFHFNQPPTYNGEGTVPSMASFVASVNGQAVVTLDYGSGSPQEAAAELAYLDAPVGATTPIGDGPEWNTSTNSWQTVDWQNAGYWASLRAAQPLAVDDGLNFLRLGRSAPFGFDDFEVGNEEYGSWETDNHTVQHDPATYVTFAKQFETLAQSIDPSILIGIDAGSPDGSYNNWLPDVLEQSAVQGLTIGFISDHNYVQNAGSENDATLLLGTVSDPESPYDWAVRASDYTSLLNQYLGSAGQSVELLTTEFNSVDTNPGKQTASLVNGLFIADSLGELMQTPYEGAIVWDLRNGFDTGNNNASSLYGWRDGGDYGLIGSSGDPPETGTYVPYPSYFAEQLASKIIQAGGMVVQATSDDPDLAVYAAKESDGDLELLVINKSPSGPITGQFSLSGFQASTAAQIWQYGEAQDTAQSESSTGSSALASFAATLTGSGSSLSYAFPAYSMSVVELSPATNTINSGPTITIPVTARENPVTGTTDTLSVSATDPAGASSLSYTWSVVSPNAQGVSFSVNGTNAASQTTVTFLRSGTYIFQVVVADPDGLTATSDATVSVSLPNQSTAPFAAVYYTVDAVWQTGFVGTITITNTGPNPIDPWMLTFDFGSKINTIWGASTVQHAGHGYTIEGVGNDASISPGQSISFGFTGKRGRSAAGPSQIKLNAVALPLSSSGPPVSAHATFALNRGPKGTFNGTVAIDNTGTIPIFGWVLQFGFAPRITSVANAAIVRHTGSTYVIRNAGYDDVIAPGASVSFQLNGLARKLRPKPIRFRLNGLPIAGSAAVE